MDCWPEATIPLHTSVFPKGYGRSLFFDPSLFDKVFDECIGGVSEFLYFSGMFLTARLLEVFVQQGDVMNQTSEFSAQTFEAKNNCVNSRNLG